MASVSFSILSAAAKDTIIDAPQSRNNTIPPKKQIFFTMMTDEKRYADNAPRNNANKVTAIHAQASAVNTPTMLCHKVVIIEPSSI